MLNLNLSVPGTVALPLAGAAAQAQPPLRAGTKVWTEERPSLTQRSTTTLAADSGAVVLNIKVEGSMANLRAVLAYIVGYSEVVSTPATRGVAQTWSLSRHTPARHPWMQGLFATKILSVTGMGNREEWGYDSLTAGSGGTMGQWDLAVISILFEIPNYDILTDAQNAGKPEYLRYTTWEPEELCETVARKGVQWAFLDPAARGVTPASASNQNQLGVFPGERILRQAKMSLKVTTYDVAIDWVYLSRIIPSNALRLLSRVNSQVFPLFGYPDVTTGATGFFRPGTALLMPSKYKQRAQAHPAVLSGQISANLLPRTVDIERHFSIFDPPCTDTTSIDLTGSDGYGGSAPVSLKGSATTLIRGHNLAPTPMPIPGGAPQAGSQWFAPINKQFPGLSGAALDAALAAARLAVTPSQLLHMYGDFEQLWQSPIPMPTG